MRATLTAPGPRRARTASNARRSRPAGQAVIGRGRQGQDGAAAAAAGSSRRVPVTAMRCHRDRPPPARGTASRRAAPPPRGRIRSRRPRDARPPAARTGPAARRRKPGGRRVAGHPGVPQHAEDLRHDLFADLESRHPRAVAEPVAVRRLRAATTAGRSPRHAAEQVLPPLPSRDPPHHTWRAGPIGHTAARTRARERRDPPPGGLSRRFQGYGACFFAHTLAAPQRPAGYAEGAG